MPPKWEFSFKRSLTVFLFAKIVLKLQFSYYVEIKLLHVNKNCYGIPLDVYIPVALMKLIRCDHIPRPYKPMCCLPASPPIIGRDDQSCTAQTMVTYPGSFTNNMCLAIENPYFVNKITIVKFTGIKILTL